MKHKRRNRAFWESVVAMIARGDASADQIAHRYGVRKSTLRWWTSQLRRKRSRVELVPVQVADVARSAVRIVSGEIAIELDGSVSLEDVASLVRALRA